MTTVLQLLGDTLTDLLHQDQRRVVLGEDVRTGGMLGLTRPAADDPDLRARLLATPLCPSTTFAHAGGLAASGMRPIVVLSSSQALLEGASGLRDVALLPWRSGGELEIPMLCIAPSGPGFGLGADATEGPESLLCRMRGLRVVTLGNPSEAGAMLRAAAEFWAGEEPTVFLVPRSLALAEVSEQAVAAQLARPFAQPHRVREGSAATVFCWGETVELARRAVEHTGLDVAVLDVEALAPLPRTALVAEASATGKLVIAHAGPRNHGVGAELAAVFADEAIYHLDAPLLRICGADEPLRPAQEGRALPTLQELVDAIVEVVGPPRAPGSPANARGG